MNFITRSKETVLLLTALGIPLIFLGRHENEPFNVPKLSLLIGAVGVASGLHLLQLALGHRPAASRSIFVPLAALTVPLILAWIASPYREWALFGQYSRFNGLIPYLCFAILSVLLVTAFPDRRHRLAWGLACVGAMVGVYAFVQSLGLDPLWRPGMDAGTPFPPSTVGHYNFAGGLMAICLPFALYVWSLPGHAKSGMTLTIATVIGLIMTNSQGGWIAAIAGTTIVAGTALRERWPRAPDIARLVAAGLAALVVVGVAISTVAERPLLGGTAKSRGLLWGTALEMGGESPLVGRGPAAYAIDGVRYRPLDYILLEPNTIADDPHSVPLSFFANAGVPGAVGVLILAIWVWREGSRVGREDVLGMTFFAACIAYLVQSLVSIDELTLRAAFWTSLAGLALSTAPPVEGPPRGRTRGSFRWRSLAASFLAIGLMVGGVAYAAGLLLAHRQVGRAKDLFAAGHVAAARASFEDALRFRFEPHYLNAYARELGRAALAAPEDRNALMARMADVNGYLRYLPQANGFIGAARIYLYWGIFDPPAFDLARAALQRARPLDPENPEVDVLMSQVLLAEGSAGDARSLLERWEGRLQGHVPAYWGVLGIARALDGTDREAQDALEHATALDPYDCRVLIARGFFERVEHGETSNQVATTLGLNCPLGDHLFLTRLSETYEV